MDIVTGIMIQTAVLVTAILAVRKLLGEKLHVYIRYGLWLLVALRLVIPVNFIDSPFSLFRVLDTVAGGYGAASSDAGILDGPSGAGKTISATSQDLASGGGTDAAEQEYKSGENYRLGMSEDPVQPTVHTQEDQMTVRAGRGGSMSTGHAVQAFFQVIWIVGSLAVGGTFLAAHLRFCRRLYRARRLCKERQKGNDGNGRGTAGFRRTPEVYRVEKLEAPCLAGVLHPAVYIGADIQNGTDKFRYVVMHERVHWLHGDHIWALLRAALVTVYWFHPFVWIAAVSSARDCELACDHGTIRLLGEEERLSYGEMLLELSRTDRGKRGYSFGTMLRPGRSEMKERIKCLARSNNTRKWAGILTAVIMFGLAGCAFTGAAEESVDSEAAEVAEDDALQEKEVADGGTMTEGSTGPAEDKDISDGENGESSDLEPDGGAGFDPEEGTVETRQLTAAAAEISAGTEFGADGPFLDYVGEFGIGGERNNVIVVHDYFGLFVYDLTDRQILRSLDLSAIGCNFTQGDNACQVAVSADGTEIWLHPRMKQYMFRYEVEENMLWQVPLVKDFEIDLESEDLFDRYLVTEEQSEGWRSNYLYEEYKDERGLQTAYIYLYVPGGEELRVGNLRCVWDDMVFILWEENSGFSDKTISAGEFPYRYDGNVHDVEIQYDVPCVFARISDGFGERVHPVTGEVRVHDGIDYAAEAGADVMAAADGTVYETGYSAEHGNYVVLLHQNGEMTYYCHCRDTTVSQEERVKRGDKIATVGSTGRSTGAHLHFALSRDGVFVNPAESMGGGTKEE